MEWLHKALLPTLSGGLLLIWGITVHAVFSLPAIVSEPYQLQSATLSLPAIFTTSLSEDDRAWRVTDTLPDAEILRRAPVSELPLRLAGIVSSGRCEGSLAIIETQKGQATWTCGAITGEDGVSIVHFFADRIVIDNNGNYESLPLAVRQETRRTMKDK